MAFETARNLRHCRHVALVGYYYQRSGQTIPAQGSIQGFPVI